MARLTPFEFAMNCEGMSDEDISILSLRTERDYYHGLAVELALGVPESKVREIEQDTKRSLRRSQ